MNPTVFRLSFLLPVIEKRLTLRKRLGYVLPGKNVPREIADCLPSDEELISLECEILAEETVARLQNAQLICKERELTRDLVSMLRDFKNGKIETAYKGVLREVILQATDNGILRLNNDPRK